MNTGIFTFFILMALLGLISAGFPLDQRSPLFNLPDDNRKLLVHQVETISKVEEVQSPQPVNAKLKMAVSQQMARLSRVPSIWPTEGTITSLFGKRKHPILGGIKFHEGVDIGNLKSTNIIAAADGVVVYSGIYKGYGKTIILDHGSGYKTLYGHAEELLVSKGDVVRKGNLIARMGSTGLSTGPHLHYEIIFAGIKVDPVLFVN